LAGKIFSKWRKKSVFRAILFGKEVVFMAKMAVTGLKMAFLKKRRLFRKNLKNFSIFTIFLLTGIPHLSYNIGHWRRCGEKSYTFLAVP